MDGPKHWKDMNTDQKIEAIRSVHYLGISASGIAAGIPGASRNAVIGMYVRWPQHLNDKPLGGGQMKLRPPREPKPRKPRAPRGEGRVRKPFITKKRSEPKPPTPIDWTPTEFDRAAPSVTLLDLEAEHCRFPVNDPAPGEQLLFCGHARDGKHSYCKHHRLRSIMREADAEAELRRIEARERAMWMTMGEAA